VDGSIRCIELGALDYLVKPFRHELLKARINSALQLKESRDKEKAYRAQIEEYSSKLEEKVRERTKEVVESRREVIHRLGQIAELRNQRSVLHLNRMSHYCDVLGRAIGMEQEECGILFQASPLHDIGMVVIPDTISLKSGRLSASEVKIMQTHTEMGAKILSGSQHKVLQMAKTIALTHHERWDGTGYPYGLKGEDIPLVGRIVALCDTFDALTTGRLYKRARSVDDAITLLENDAGKHFSPELVAAFKKALPETLKFKEQYSEAYVWKGIILFDIRNFLYQGMEASDDNKAEITNRQVRVLQQIHADMMKEREQRLASKGKMPTVDMFLPTGDGYYMLCEPDFAKMMDISYSIMALLSARRIEAYCVAHMGEVCTLPDVTGRSNATSFDLGLASRLLSLAKITGQLTVSETVANLWHENDYFQLDTEWHNATAKDGVDYRWKLGRPKQLEDAKRKYQAFHLE
jgi:putative two-component system response regulator